MQITVRSAGVGGRVWHSLIGRLIALSMLACTVAWAAPATTGGDVSTLQVADSGGPTDTRWTIPYGTEAGQVGFANSANTPGFEDAVPFGPLSFRVHGDRLFLADSVRGRILEFGPGGDLLKQVTVPGVGTDTLIEDFALLGADGMPAAPGAVPAAVVIAEAAGQRLLCLDWATGAVRWQVTDPEHLVQIQQVEADPAGGILAVDIGRRQVRRFTANGLSARDLPGGFSGVIPVALPEHRGGVGYWTIEQRGGAGFHAILRDLGARTVSERCLGLPRATNPRVWGLDPDGTLWATFIPPGGFRGELLLLGFDPSGATIAQTSVRPPTALNRFLQRSNGGFDLVFADHGRAPAGAVRVARVNRDPKAVAAGSSISEPPTATTVLATFSGPLPRALLGAGSHLHAILADDRLVRVNWHEGHLDGVPEFDGPVQAAAVASDGRLVAIGLDGQLRGSAVPTDPRFADAARTASRLEFADDGALVAIDPGRLEMTGPQMPGSEQIASEPTRDVASAPGLAVPVRDGFFLHLTAAHDANGLWQLELADAMGNGMKPLFRFDPSFEPSGLMLGPASQDGDVLLRFAEHGTAWWVLFAQNGRMQWRIREPAGACTMPRVAFGGPDGALLVPIVNPKGGWNLVAIRIQNPQG